MLSLYVAYTDKYPDEPPRLAITVLSDGRQILGAAPDENAERDGPEADAEPETDTREGVQHLWEGLQPVITDSLGMPMVYTLASHLRESLTDYMAQQAARAAKEASDRRDAELRAEEEKFRGTAVTVERFAAWRAEFMAEVAKARADKEQAYMATLSNKEREEYKRMRAKPTGRELFSKPGVTDDDDRDAGDDAVKEVDFSQYSREEREQWTHEESDEEAGFVDDLDE